MQCNVKICIVSLFLVQCKQRKHTAYHRSCGKLKTTRIATSVYVVEVRECTPCCRLINPFGNLGDKHTLCFRLGNCCGEQFPVDLGPDIACVENDAVLPLDLEVEVTLHVINLLWDEVEAQEFVRVDVVEETWQQ